MKFLRKFKESNEEFVYSREELAEKLSNLEMNGEKIPLNIKPEDLEEVYEITNAMDDRIREMTIDHEDYDKNKRIYVIILRDGMNMFDVLKLDGILEDENGYYIPFSPEYMG